MLKSMTGFGRGECFDENRRFIVEMKAVNHRYNEVVIRMPKKFGSLEDKIRKQVTNSLSRGRIDVFVTADEYSEGKRNVVVDKELAIGYHKALQELAGMLSIPPHENVSLLTSFPDVLKVEEVHEEAITFWPNLSVAVDAAIQNLMTMRQEEGANIYQDLMMRIDKLQGLVAQVEVNAPNVWKQYRNSLLDRMRDLLAEVGAEPDESRLLQECAIFADRTNFTEELVRLQSHFNQFRSSLALEEPVGRKLDFIVQEMNREANTIASKANDVSIANLVIDIKSEIEKVREQIQNIE